MNTYNYSSNENYSSKEPSVQKDWSIPLIPKDQFGFVKSFKLNQEVELLKFFDEFGFVVLEGILDDQSIKNTIDEIWSELEGKTLDAVDISTLSRGEQLYLEGVQLEKNGNAMEAMEKYMRSFHLCPQLEDELVSQKLIKRAKAKIVDRNNPLTWEDKNWAVASSVGFLGVDVCVGPMAWNNRQNPNVYQAFSTLLNKKDLWVSVDRFGVMRPTKNVPLGKLPENLYRTDVAISSEENGNNSVEVVNKDDWRSAANWTHWDMNPWMWTLHPETGSDYYFPDFFGEYNETKPEGTPKLQGALVLSESTEEDGGFCLVPGFHKLLKEWCSMNMHKESANGTVPPARPGSLIIWRGEMPHCNYPNNSNKLRLAQYIRMIPAHEGAPGTDLRKMQIAQLIPQSVQVSELGEKLFSLHSWS